MGNENEINKDLVETTQQFLPDELHDTDGESQIYNLEDEFAKTKKNRNLPMYFFMLGFAIAVIIGTVLFTAYINERKDKAPLKIDEFQDLRLKELLNSSKNVETDLEKQRRELDELKINKQNALLNLKDRYIVKRQAIMNQTLTDEETDNKIAELKKAEARDAQRISKRYDRWIAQKTQGIGNLKTKVGKDQNSIKKTMESKGIVGDNYNELQNLKMRSIHKTKNREINSLKRYQNRQIRSMKTQLDPWFKSKQINKIIKTGPRYARLSVNSFDDLMVKEGVASNKEFMTLKKKINNQYLLIRRIRLIPFEHSLPGTFRRINVLHASIVNDYEKMRKNLLTVIKKKNRELSMHHYALDRLLEKRPESGYILDSRQPSSMVVYMKKVIKVRSGIKALVFRKDDEYIGKIKFYYRYGELRARVIEVARNKKIQPYDRILIKMK